ncbi:hypothetical protein VMT65_29685 [Nocardia sp. CDC153]|uniref:hypothetical protein n=1 Tax=Nocardia sp. CDC153 TaxID=3112167 RepID=UPI002DBB5B36|nr:hypothetical protein [Nocardia sp. CDC153]MEC3957238.1 hypothetical protein [Nocardia sp. CDC153]
MSRTMTGALVGLILTPIGIAFAARGAAGTRQWTILGDFADRVGSTFEIVIAAAIFLVVAALAAYSAAGTITAGLVWGVLPGIIHFIFPDDTFRLIGDLPVSDDMHIALFQWLQTGFPLIVGILLVGAGAAATFRRR